MAFTVRPSSLTDVLFEDVTVGRCLVAPDGTVLRVNAEWLRATGFAEAQVIGAPIVDLFPATRDMAIAMHERARAGHRVEVPRHSQLVNGRETWWEGSIEPVAMEGGTGLVITAREIRGVHANEEHAALAAQHQLALDAARMGWWRYDAVTRVASYDARYREIFGITGERLSNDEILKLIHPRDLRRVWAAVGAALDPVRRDRYSAEFRLLRPDGSLRWVEAHGIAIFDGDGPEARATSLVGTVQDVTERRAVVESLRESTALVRAISDTSGDVIFAKDVAGRLRFANPATLALIGKPLSDVLGRTDAEVLADPDAAREVMANDRRIMDSGVAEDLEERVPLPDGTERVWFSRKVPYRDEAGNVVGLLGISRDITDRKLEEEELRRAQGELRDAIERLRDADRRKDDFLAMLAHELRNPLAPIRNSSYIIRHAAQTSDQARRAQEVIERQTQHLTRLVDDLLDVTRIARGKIELRRDRVDLREVVGRAADDVRFKMDGNGVTFRVAMADARLWADADPTRIAQMVGNLLHNASKFTRAGDEVSVSVSVANGFGEIRVRDTGAGIDPALLPHVFEPFVQADHSLARTQGGLGLGLALVKGIAELHGGSVLARSGGKGAGAEFIVRLPLVEAAASDADRENATPVANRGRHVLVVDDNRDAAESLAELVRMLGHDADVAFDGPTALELARAKGPDTVLCDIGMPGMSGYEVARMLRAEGRAVQLFAVSGYAQPEDVKRAVEAGFDAHVAKPPDIGELERLLS